MGEDKLTIISDTRKMDGWVKGIGNDNVTFNAKVFDEPSVFGIDEGRVSKLEIRKDNKWIVNYDRGWDIGPSPEHLKIYESVMAKLNDLDMIHSLEGGNHIMDDNNTPQTGSGNSPPLEQNEYVQELFSILQENGKETNGLAALIGHVGEMENFVKRAEDKIADMKSQLAEMKEIQNHPVKTKLRNAIKSLENTVAEMKERITELKANIIEGCKSAVDAFKEKGAAALNNLAKFFHIKGGLQAIDKVAEQSIKQCDKAIAHVNGFAENYHEAGRAIKNMGLIIIGREPVDEKKENGKLAKVAAAPYKAEKAAMSGIKSAVDKAIASLDGMEERQAVKKQERTKKPSVLEALEENKMLAAEHNRGIAEREKALVKGAEL